MFGQYPIESRGLSKLFCLGYIAGLVQYSSLHEGKKHMLFHPHILRLLKPMEVILAHKYLSSILAVNIP